jgi:hypothetical protein
LLLEVELDHERRAADEQQREDEQEVEDLEPEELEQRIGGDGPDARGGEEDVFWSPGSKFEDSNAEDFTPKPRCSRTKSTGGRGSEPYFFGAVSDFGFRIFHWFFAGEVTSRKKFSRVVCGLRSARMRAPDWARRVWIWREDFGGGVFEDDLGLVFDGDEVVEPALADEDALVEDADAVADFLDLAQEVGAEQDGDAALLEIEDEVANLAGARRDRRRRWARRGRGGAAAG